MSKPNRAVAGARRGVLQIALGSLFGQGLVIALSPVLSRLYAPVDFAVLQMFTAVVSVAATLATLRLEFAIPLAEDEDEARAVGAAGLWATVLGSALVGLVGWLTADLWAHGASLEGLRAWFWTVPPTIAALAAFQVVSAQLVRRQHYRDLAVRNGVQGIGTAVAQVGLGLLPFGPLGLLAGTGVGRSLALVAMTRTARRGERPPRRVGVREMLGAVSRFRRFPLINSWSTVVNRIGQYAPYVVFAAAFGATPMGLLTFTARLMAVPVQMVSQAVSQVYFGSGAVTLRETPEELPRLTWRATRQLALFGVGPAVLVVLLGPWAFALVFGEAWREAGSYAAVLAVAFLSQLVAAPAGYVFVLLERQGVALAWEIVRLAMVLGGPLLAWKLGGTALIGVAVYSAALFLSYVGVIVLAWWVLRRA